MEDWPERLEDLAARRAAATAMGGEERLARQRAGGRLDARARVERLCDPGTFVELGALVGGAGDPAVPADGLVAGHGLVDGRPVLVGAEDFTVQGGSIGIGTHAKRHRLASLAGQERVPLVLLLDGAGERASNAGQRYPRAPNDLQALVAISGLVPTVAAVLGPSAGHGALSAPLMDHVVMVEGASLFSAGPPLVARATGEQVTPEQLGGVDVHAEVSGVAHDAVPDEGAALARVRAWLSYLPSNAWLRPPVSSGGDTGARRVEALYELVPTDNRRPYDVRPVVEAVVDEGSVLELSVRFGAPMITALARLGGRPVAVVANQPAVRAGAVDRDAADKAAHFLDVAAAYHLPVLFLADNPGVLAGTAAERSGALRAAARLYAAQARVRAPKLHVTLRKAYGFGSSVMAMNPFDGQTVTLALPGAELAAMPSSAGGPPPVYRTADTMGYDDVVDPAELRNALLAALRLASARLTGPVEPVASTGVRP
ncbi:MAG TPA: carboxyl transferase domain-containing protein [Acidimicrobiales bacterium]|nr:carboxyl transferase domain-containing protein [Acidimicrobiales bacterium]